MTRLFPLRCLQRFSLVEIGVSLLIFELTLVILAG